MELQYDKVNQPSCRFHLCQGPHKDSAAKRAEIKRQEGPPHCQVAGWHLGQQAQNSFSFLDQQWEVNQSGDRGLAHMTLITILILIFIQYE